MTLIGVEIAIVSDIDPCRDLADEIRRILREGIELSTDVVEFIDSTYASPNAEEILAIFNADSDADRDTLLELIFTPDQHIQEILEPILGRHGFSPQEETMLLDQLCHPTLQCVLIFPDSRREVTVSPPVWVYETFLSRLYITRKLPEEIEGAIAQTFDAPLRWRIRVHFRNMQVNFTKSQIDCLCRYMATVDSQHPSFFPNLEFLTQFLSGLGSTGDIYASLMAHKEACLSQLEQAMKQEKALAENNMETLLLRGERILHYDKDGLIRDIAAIDDISLAVFGKTEALLPKGSTINLGEYQGREDLDRLIKLLSDQ